MATIRPYLLFGHIGAPAGGMNDYQSAWFTQGEAQSEAQRLGLTDWQIAVYQSEALLLVENGTNHPNDGEIAAAALPGGNGNG